MTGYPSDPNEPLSQPRINNGDTGKISGGNYYWYFYDASRTTVTGKLSHHADSFLGAEQDFHFGVQYNQAGVSGVYGYNDFIYTYLSGGVQYGYGKVRQTFSYGATARNVGAFVDDSVRLGNRMTLNLGVRFDHSSAFAPPQDELDDNAQPTGKTFPKADFFTWDSVSPRLGLNFKLTGDGKTILKSHWGRYHPQITTGEFANIIGPNVKPYFIGTYNPATGQIEDLVLESSSENLSMAPDYHPPRTDQFIVGFERELNTKMGLQVNYVRKWGRDFARMARHGGHLRPGTGRRQRRAGSHRHHEQRLPVDEQPELAEIRVGELRRLAHRHPRSDRQPDQAHDPLVCQRRASPICDRPERSAEACALRSIQQRSALEFSIFGRNPNDFVNLDGRLVGDVGWQGKFQGVVRLRWGIQASASLDAREGAHRIRTRSIPASIAGQGSTTILLQPRGDFGRLSAVTIVDARLQKDFALGRGARLGLFLDALNLNNENAPQGVQSANVTSSVYQYPNTFVFPRRFMLSGKFSF